MNATKQTLVRYAMKNKSQLENSQLAGCYYCLQTFPASEIKEYVDKGLTALCPHCGIDSVVGDVCGYELSKNALQEAHEYWFKPKK